MSEVVLWLVVDHISPENQTKHYEKYSCKLQLSKITGIPIIAQLENINKPYCRVERQTQRLPFRRRW